MPDNVIESGTAPSGVSVDSPAPLGSPAPHGTVAHPWRRVLLKLSGEAMAGAGSLGVDPDVVSVIAREIADVVRDGTQVAVVIGGGNYFRGAQLSERGMDRARATTWACWARS